MCRSQLLLVFVMAFVSFPVQAGTPEYNLVIKDHQFQPARLEVPAGVRIKLSVHNQDPTPEEFESYELNREKIIPGNSLAIVYIGPLSPGEYPFFGEFNPKTAQGVLIATQN